MSFCTYTLTFSRLFGLPPFTRTKQRQIVYRVEQLHLLKLKAFLNFESSTHSVVKWPVEFGFIIGSRYVQVYSLANQIRVSPV